MLAALSALIAQLLQLESAMNKAGLKLKLSFKTYSLYVKYIHNNFEEEIETLTKFKSTVYKQGRQQFTFRDDSSYR